MYEILTIGLVHTLCHHLRVEDYWHQLAEQVFPALAFRKRQHLLGHAIHHLVERLFGETRLKLLTSVMMMDATGKPHTLEINDKSLEIVAFSVTLIVAIDSLQCLTNAKIVLALLVEGNVSPHESCLRQAIDIHFLVERKLVESLQLVTKHLDVGKSLISIYITLSHNSNFEGKSNTFISHFKLFRLFFIHLAYKTPNFSEFVVIFAWFLQCKPKKKI